MRRFSFYATTLLALAAICDQSFGQEILFQTSFDSDAGLVFLPDGDADAENNYEYFGFDGIPEAPTSAEVGGEANRGLKLQANIDGGEISSVAVATDNLNLSGKYAVQVDVWLNYNFPAGTNGTTEFGGLSVGHDGETPNLAGATFLYDTDGDSGSDYRMYKNTTFHRLYSFQYEVESLNNAEEPFVSAFLGVDIAEAVPEQFIEGQTDDGVGGFRWMILEAVVDTEAIGVGDTDDPGLATFSITDAESGNKVEIGTIDNSNSIKPTDGAGVEIADAPTVVNMSGDVALVFTDIFASVSNNADLSFGLFDNLIITSIDGVVSDPLDCNADGSVTSADIACATAATIADTLTAASIPAGDLDLDGTVAFADFLVLSSNFGSAGGGYAAGDIDLDGTVAFADFLALSANFGKTGAGAQAVPEPSSLALVLLGAMSLAWRRRRS